MSDTIYRQAAIDAVYKCANIFINNLPVMVDKADAYKALAELPSAQPKSCEDAVSKADVLETYADLYDVFEDNKQIIKELHRVYDKLNALPSAQPEIIYCKDCRKHNVNAGYKEGCCPLYEWRGVSYGHEHDYQYCCHAERKNDV